MNDEEQRLMRTFFIVSVFTSHDGIIIIVCAYWKLTYQTRPSFGKRFKHRLHTLNCQ